ncbi:unnamed protein product [Larinioides sclopetarius]|uniref:Uncharacterized protein n=1 Tax=Larinioides sclopetarius TaxID=280406 RepID=A0AAV1ZXV5_9ARAC
MNCHVYFNWSFLVAVFLVGYVFTQDINEINQKFLQNVGCIAKSKNQTLCDEYLKECNEELPKTLLDSYNNCLNALFANDENECTDDQELYYSDEDREELNECIFDHIDCLCRSDLQQLAVVRKCAEDLAKEAGCAVSESG